MSKVRWKYSRISARFASGSPSFRMVVWVMRSSIGISSVSLGSVDDDHLAEMGAAFLVVQGRPGLGKGEDPVDDRPDGVQPDGAVHGQEHLPGADEDSLDT